MNHRPQHIPLPALGLDRINQALGSRGQERLTAGLDITREALAGRALWNINSTARGGGVAEMLSSMLPYLRGADIDSRWTVISSDKEFFDITKRLHNLIHGSRGDGGSLGEEERKVYKEHLHANYRYLCESISQGDVVILHDPQVAGLAEGLKRQGATVIWRCHIGSGEESEETKRAWNFLTPFLDSVDAFIFSRPELVPATLEGQEIDIIRPSIDPISAKNYPISSKDAWDTLGQIGLTRQQSESSSFIRQDGSPGRVEHGAEVICSGSPVQDGPLVVQISRWDRLKDHLGLMRTFADEVVPYREGQLILAGPSVYSVADDPEAATVLDEIISAWWRLGRHAREHISLACLPMSDVEENGAIVNALQTAADLVVQKSIAEGFGLTVSEAMWKEKVVLASAVGGIKDQIEDRRSGILLDDPFDLKKCGQLIVKELDDPSPDLATRAKERVRENFLHDRQIFEQGQMLSKLLAIFS